MNENKENKNVYKLVVFNNTDHSLYTLSSVEEKRIINADFIKENYYNYSTRFIDKIIEKVFHKNNVVMISDIVSMIIEMHRELGNNNYVKKLSEHQFNNKIIMAYQDYSGKGKMNTIFPWTTNDLLYNIFLEENITSPYVIFCAVDQFNTNNTYDEKEYAKFYDDVLSLINICSDCSEEIKRHEYYNELLDPEENENKVQERYPNIIKIHVDANNSIDIIDVEQVKDYVENVMFDDNYYNDHKFSKIKDSNLVIQAKKGITYIGNSSTGDLEAFFSDPGSYKYKS